MNKTLKIKKKGNEGITLIALVITIIVLIILAGITINLLMGDNGILTRAKGTKEEFNKSKMLEDTTILLMDYSAEHELTGITLKDYLNKNNISFEEDGTNIKFVEEGYELTVNPITLELDGPTKSNKTAKISLSSNAIEQNGTLTVTLTFGEDVDVQKCKYKFAKASETVEKEDVTTAISGTTITIPSSETTQKGEYYFYLLVAYKDNTESLLKKTKVTVGVPVTGVSLNKKSLNLFDGESTNSEPLVASVLPSNAVQGIDWSTSDSNVATVNQEGVVTAIGGGIATITATSTDDMTKTATCTVVVEALQSIAITVPPTKIEYNKKDTLDLTGMVVTATYTTGRIQVLSSNQYTATPADGSTLNSGGTKNITINYSQGNQSKNVITTVHVTAVTEWTLTDNDSSGTITVGDLVTPKLSNSYLSNEQFYIINIGTQDDPILTLLAKLGLKTNSSTDSENIQSTNPNIDVKFDESQNKTTEYEDSTIKLLVDTYVEKLTTEGLTLEDVEVEENGNTVTGVKGRLMWKSEAEDSTLSAVSNYSNIIYSQNREGWGYGYWIGTPYSDSQCYLFYSGNSNYISHNKVDVNYGLRPVIKVLASNIEIPSN